MQEREIRRETNEIELFRRLAASEAQYREEFIGLNKVP